MKFLKDKTFWTMVFIITLGTVLRLIFINKPEGLWNDEYISWSIASIPLGKNFINAVFAQCHMPFYYLYLKFFIHFFGNSAHTSAPASDLMLRLTSVITGILGIVSMYFVGKELKGKNLGIICAGITAISSFSIYFSQEVRLYSVLFLFASLALLFTIKLAREQNLSNFIFYLLFNFLIMFTHTIGFVFVFFNLVFSSLWITRINKQYKKPIIIGWAAIAVLGLTLLPLISKIFTTHSFSQWWGHFTVSKIAFLFTDYFSPILTNIVNAPESFFYNFTLSFAFFAILPAIIALIGLVKALSTKQYKILGLFLVSLSYVLVLIVMAISGKLMFITKYSMEIYPTLIALVGFGLVSMENKNLSRVLIFLFCSINLFYILSNPNSAPRMHRAEGHKIVADLLKHADLKKGDYILLNYYGQDKFGKYFDFNGYNVVSINKGNFPEYLSKDITYEDALKDGKNLYKDVFSGNESKYFNNKLDNEIINKLKHNKKITIVVLNAVASYSPVKMQSIIQNQDKYKKTPLLFLVFSYIKNQTLEECLAKLQISKIEQKGSWSAITFVKY